MDVHMSGTAPSDGNNSGNNFTSVANHLQFQHAPHHFTRSSFNSRTPRAPRGRQSARGRSWQARIHSRGPGPGPGPNHFSYRGANADAKSPANFSVDNSSVGGRRKDDSPNTHSAENSDFGWVPALLTPNALPSNPSRLKSPSTNRRAFAHPHSTLKSSEGAVAADIADWQVAGTGSNWEGLPDQLNGPARNSAVSRSSRGTRSWTRGTAGTPYSLHNGRGQTNLRGRYNGGRYFPVPGSGHLQLPSASNAGTTGTDQLLARGSESSEAEHFYAKLEAKRQYREQTSYIEIDDPLPAFERTNNSALDLLLALNDPIKPFLKIPELWTIFHQKRAELGLPQGFVPYHKLEELIEPIAEAIEEAKRKKRSGLAYYSPYTDVKTPQATHSRIQEPWEIDFSLEDGLPSNVFSQAEETLQKNEVLLNKEAVQQLDAGGSIVQPLLSNSTISANNNPNQQTADIDMASSTRTVDQFLIDVRGLIKEQNARAFAEYLVIEPPLPPPYQVLINELKQHFPKDKKSVLENKCEGQLNLSNAEEQWSAFPRFMAQYFSFLRDLDPTDLLETFLGLNTLIQMCNTAFGHPTHGSLLLSVILAYSRILARLAIGLDKHPELMYVGDTGADEGDGISLPERAANTIREAFITCIRDKSPGLDGKWVATIKLANICLKILFQSGRVDRSIQIFQNMDTFVQSHPLSQFSRADRITFLYYAGKAAFVVGQFYSASEHLEQAYLECHSQALKQRRMILIPLVVSNLLLGRFPSEYIYHRDEAVGLRENIGPICSAIKRGDIESFRRLTSFASPTGEWLLNRKILLQIRDGCELFLWRSFIRKVSLLAGEPPGMTAQGRPTAASLDLHTVSHLARYLEKRALSQERVNDGGPGNRNLNWIFKDEEDAIPPGVAKQLVAAEFDGVKDPKTGRDLYRNPPPSLLDNLLPTIDAVECTVASMIAQGFVNGYIHRTRRQLAIQGARSRSGGPATLEEAVAAGFPKVWDFIKKASMPVEGASNGTPGPGQVIRMTDARPAGM